MAGAFVEALAPDAGRLAESARQNVIVIVLGLDGWHRFHDEALALLDEAEAARARRQRNPRNRDALVLTYALHRLLLSNVLRCAPGEVDIQRDDKGCPRLPGDVWHTSLSHSANHVAFAVSMVGPVGIDLEPADRARDMDSITERVVHRDELDALAGLPADARSHALLDLWVRKEALLKAAGIGLECGMETFSAPVGVPLPLPGERFAGRETSLHMVDAGPDWACATASPPGTRIVRVLVKGPHGVS